ncbi:MAG: carboxylating nicotinate-nucleotide diphosphorylase [Opitutales bacterium]
MQAADALIDLALAEDIGLGDVSAETLFPADARAAGTLVAKAPLTVCGLGIAARVFARVDPVIRFEPLVRDGDGLAAGAVLARFAGPTRALLMAERTALNFLQMLSGIATQAARYAARTGDTGIRIVDTRKTIPGFRALAKYAVRCGGCHNHRASLADCVMIKDNHLAVHGSIAAAVAAARAGAPHTAKIEVEVTSPALAGEAAEAGADIILLDNMDPEAVKAAVTEVGSRAIVEVSGGIGWDNLEGYLLPGVDVISIGALTHTFQAADISLRFDVPAV